MMVLWHSVVLTYYFVTFILFPNILTFVVSDYFWAVVFEFEIPSVSKVYPIISLYYVLTC